MAISFWGSKPKTPPTPPPGPTPHTYGQVTPREFKQDVMGRLRQAGMSARDRNIVETAAAGYLDKEYGKPGMNYREAGEFEEELHEVGRKIGLDDKDISRVEDAIDRSLSKS